MLQDKTRVKCYKRVLCVWEIMQTRCQLLLTPQHCAWVLDIWILLEDTNHLLKNLDWVSLLSLQLWASCLLPGWTTERCNRAELKRQITWRFTEVQRVSLFLHNLFENVAKVGNMWRRVGWYRALKINWMYNTSSALSLSDHKPTDH